MNVLKSHFYHFQNLFFGGGGGYPLKAPKIISALHNESATIGENDDHKDVANKFVAL